MLRIVTTFALLSILGIALSGVAAFGASPSGADRLARWVSVDSVALLGCGTGGEPAGQSRVAVGASGGTARIVYGFVACDGNERQLGMDVFVIRAEGGFELTVRDHETGETVVRRLRPSSTAVFALSGLNLRFTVADQSDSAS
jgi:hypothetical protein